MALCRRQFTFRHSQFIIALAPQPPFNDSMMQRINESIEEVLGYTCLHIVS
jgi:hypothetical protein